MKIGFGFRLLLFGFVSYLRLFVLILGCFLIVLLSRRSRECHLRLEHRCLDAFRLIIAPLIGSLDLIHHRLIRMMAGKQAGDCGQDGKNCGAQSHPRNPWRTAMLGVVVNFLFQMLQWNLGFLHRGSLGSELLPSRSNSARQSSLRFGQGETWTNGARVLALGALSALVYARSESLHGELA